MLEQLMNALNGHLVLWSACLVAGLMIVPGAAAAQALPAASGEVAAQSESGAEIVSLDVAPSHAVADAGFVTLTVEVALRDPSGLRDVMWPGTIDSPYAVRAARADGVVIGWPQLRRVSGTAFDGIWEGSVEVSPRWAGHSYRVTHVQVQDFEATQDPVVLADGPTFEVGTMQAWELRSDSSPVRVVWGNETWVPRARVVDRATQRPIAGASIATQSPFTRLQARLLSAPSMSTDADGVWVSPTARPVDAADPQMYLAYGKRGTRGWSLEDAGCLEPTIKIQANSRYSTQSLSLGESVTVTGNAWPAPAIRPTGTGNIYLQRATSSGKWETVGRSVVRHNGRYTVTWTPTARGTEQLRIRRPGSTFRGLDRDCGGTIGTNLVSVPVRVG